MSEKRAEYVAGTAVVPVQTDVPMNVEAAVDRHNLVVKFVETLLREGIDYGTVPGIDRPFLLKPGAEKLAAFFGLRIEVDEIQRLEDWGKPLFAYSYRCTLRHGGEIVAQCIGSCNSMESKYRYRVIWESKATDADKERAIRVERRRGYDKQMKNVYIVENDDPYSLLNTIQKMAQKRAIVGAVHAGCSVSEFFSHDMREIDDLDDVKTEEQEEAELVSPAAGIRQRLVDAAAQFKPNGKPTDAQRGLLCGKIAEALQDTDDKLRHLVLKYLWGKESSKELSYGEVGAMLKWLIEGKDGQTGDYLLNRQAVQEIQIVAKEAQIDVGQLVIELYGEAVPA